MQKEIRIATRQSPLALWQATHVKERLEAQHKGLVVTIKGMVTRGDQWLAGTLQEQGGKGLFVKQLEDALLEDMADIAVHSLKDVPTVLPEGLVLGAVLKGESPYDVLVSVDKIKFDALAKGAHIGTASLRRGAQLKRLRPDLEIVPIRGNVHTRLKKLEQGQVDALVLAEAGLVRLGFEAMIAQRFSLEECVPSNAQGVLTVEHRVEDTDIEKIVAVLEDPDTRARILAERALNHHLGGSCSAPIAIFGSLQGSSLMMKARVLSLDGVECIEVSGAAAKTEPERLGVHLAKQLLKQGAKRLLE